MRLGAVDAISAGIEHVLRRPALILVPVAVDLALWLAPRVSFTPLLQRFAVIWEAWVRIAYGQAQAATADEMTAFMRDALAELSKTVDLSNIVLGSWLSMPGLSTGAQSSRLLLISDAVLAPAGFSLRMKGLAPPPWQPATVELQSTWAVLLAAILFWLIGQAIIVLVIWLAAGTRPALEGGDVADGAPALPDLAGWGRAERWHGAGGLLALGARLAALNLILAVAVLLLYLPLGVLAGLASITGSSGAGLLFVLTGGLALWMLMWFLTSVYFASEGIVLRGLGLGAGLWESLQMVRVTGLRTLTFVTLVNLLLLGLRGLAGLASGLLPGALAPMVAIVANGFLATSMLVAVFFYYAELRRQVTAAQRARQDRTA